MTNQLYIDLLKNVLVDLHRIEYGEFKPLGFETYNPTWKTKLLIQLDKYFNTKGLTIVHKVTNNKEDRIEGRDYPAYAETMIGLKRLNNIEYCVKKVLEENIEGDLIETGAWRGGATIFMKALLKANNITDRIVWVADSFEGLPKPNVDKYEIDKGDKHHLKKELSISIDIVKDNFKKYDLLDDKVKFLKGWFKDTLPKAPIDHLSILRLDGDMYESTMDSLVYLYPKLSKGGFLIIDDWNAVWGCKQAILDYREENEIVEEIVPIDSLSAYWRKEN